MITYREIVDVLEPETLADVACATCGRSDTEHSVKTPLGFGLRDGYCRQFERIEVSNN